MALSDKARRDAWCAAALTAVASIVLYPRALLRGESFFERDLFADWYQRLLVLSRGIAQGAWPTWDPTVGFGYPLLADPGAQLLYPPAWLAFLLPRGVGYTAFVVAHLLVASLGMARLARALGVARAGALAAGLCFILSGPLQSTVNLRHHFAAAALLPWVILAVEGTLRRPGPRSVVALASVATLQVLAGSPDVCALSVALTAAWVAARLFRRGSTARPAACLLGAVVLSVGLTAAQWWPTADVLSRSPRQSLPEEVRVAWSVPREGLWRTVLPLDPERVPWHSATWTRLYERPALPFFSSLYLGLPTLVLNGVALLVGRRRRLAAGIAAAGTLALAFAMGPHGPLYGPASTIIPLIRIFRYPSKATLVTAFAVALLAGLGVDALARRRLGERALAWAAALAVLATALVVAVSGRFGERPWVAGALLSGALALTLGLRAYGRLGAVPAAFAAVSLAAADLVQAHAGLNATAPEALIFERPSLVANVDRSGARRLYAYDYYSVPGTSEKLLGRSNAYGIVGAPRGANRQLLESRAVVGYLMPPTGGFYGLENSYDMDLRGLSSIELNDLSFFLRLAEGTPLHTKLLQLGGVGTVISLHTRGLENLEPIAVLPSLFLDPVRVWRVPGDPRRSWVVGCARAADRGAAFRALADPGFDPRAEVILADAPPSGGRCGPAGESRLSDFRSDLVRLEVQADRPGFVVLADAFDPGWQATVDERATPLLRADVAFRAVAVPAGRHVVEMRYWPHAITAGLACSLLSLVAMLAVGWAFRKRPAPQP